MLCFLCVTIIIISYISSTSHSIWIPHDCGVHMKKKGEKMIHIFGIYDIWNTSNLSACKAIWTKFLDGNKIILIFTYLYTFEKLYGQIYNHLHGCFSFLGTRCIVLLICTTSLLKEHSLVIATDQDGDM